MKTSILKITAIMLVLVGCFYSCKNDDIDMSKIDFSNIENLYAQPLPVIQKCVQGKWKWYVSYGGVVGISYPVNTFVDIYDDHCTIRYEDGSQRTSYFTWKRCSLPDGHKTWAMWDKERDSGIWCFSSITNDTLGVRPVPLPDNDYMYIHFGNGFARVK